MGFYLPLWGHLPHPIWIVKSGTISRNIKNIIKVIAYLHIFYIEFENSTFNGQLFYGGPQWLYIILRYL